MPAIKVLDKNPRANRRRPILWEFFGKIKVNPAELKEGKGIYYAIVPQEKIDEVINDKSKQIFQENGFEAMSPIEYNALRTIVVHHIDKVTDEYEDEDKITSINETNQWAQAESIYRIQTTGRMLKIRLKNPQMANQATRDGLIIIHQQIPPKHREKETFVRITPCYNCFGYEHKTKECPKEKQILCSFCAGRDHQQHQCQETEPKCINCNGKHRTLAAACQVRKEILRKKWKELRERSRSRSRQRAITTYAGAMQGNREQHQQRQEAPTIENIDQAEMKKLIAKIVTSIRYAHYMESIHKGTFQKNIVEMFRLNGIPRVVFPATIVTDGIREILKDNQATQQQDIRPDETEEESRGATAMKVDSHKRTRELSISPQIMNESKKKRDEEQKEQTIERQEDSDKYQPENIQRHPPQPPPRQPREDEEEQKQRERERTKTTKPAERRDVSITKHLRQLGTKDVGITVILKRSSRYNIESTDKDKRESIRETILKGEAKFQWTHPGISYEAIHNGFIKKIINMNEIQYMKCPDSDFPKLKFRCTTQTNQK